MRPENPGIKGQMRLSHPIRILVFMTTQLTLIPENAWKLDEQTKRIGRKGLADARAVLARRTEEPAEIETLRLAA